MYEQYSSQEFEEKYTYSGNLGAFWTPEKTAFRLWAPTAGAVSIRLYRSGDPVPTIFLPSFGCSLTPAAPGRRNDSAT